MTFNCFSSCLMSYVFIEITINTSRRQEHSKQWNDTSQFSSHKVTVSHAIVILLTLTCQLTPKSNSHISLPLLRLYINYSISNAIQFTSLQLRVQYSTVQLQLVQQCIQISTRINSSMYIRTSSFVSLETPCV